MDVILTAGGIPGVEDPLYPFTQGKPKALLSIGGKPMIQWILNCLAAVNAVDQVVLVGLDDEYSVEFPRTILRMENRGDMVSNITSAAQLLLEKGPSNPQALVMASDVPAVTPEMIAWMIENVAGTDNDITYTVVTKAVMDARYPNARRSFIKFKDTEVCGGDVNAINVATINYDNPIWRKLVDNRKNALKQAALLGFDTLLLVLLKSLTLAQTETRICKRLGINGRLLVSPYAETAMDVDKPGQLELMDAEFRLAELMGENHLTSFR